MLNACRLGFETNKEVIFVNLKVRSHSIKIGVLYRPPQSNVLESSEISRLLRDQLDNVQNFVVMGDFNFPVINWEDNCGTNGSESYFLEILKVPLRDF